jgi:SAM-dependent methyltransferase
MCRSTSSRQRLSVRRAETDFDIAQCAECRFVYVRNPRRETFHPIQQAPERIVERARHRQIKRVCDRHLARRAAPRDRLRILEVGAGWGGLAKVFSRDARYEYIGFEPSDDRAAFCRAHGLEVRHGFFAGPETAGVVDAIVFDNVLEHLEDPDLLVGAAVASLREGGLLIVLVPNVNDVRQHVRVWRERHHWQPHCHINYFSVADLERLFERHGLDLHFFGLGAAGSSRADLGLLPRVLADALGLHLLGLNVYGIKPARA